MDSNPTSYNQVPYHYGGSWQDARDSYAPGCPPDLTFPGVADRSSRLLTSAVVLHLNGTLAFSLNGDYHGQYLLDIELVDSGGSDRGGEPRSVAERLWIQILPVNDAPVLRFAAHSLEVTQGCLGYVPPAPFPNGWTWTTDPAVCEARRGVPVEGCWTPLWQCAYDATFLGMGDVPRDVGGRRLLAAGGEGANESSANETATFFLTFRGEVHHPGDNPGACRWFL